MRFLGAPRIVRCFSVAYFPRKDLKDQFHLVTLVLMRSLLFRFFSLKSIHILTGDRSRKPVVSRVGKCRIEKNDSILNIKKRPCKEVRGSYTPYISMFSRNAGNTDQKSSEKLCIELYLFINGITLLKFRLMQWVIIECNKFWYCFECFYLFETYVLFSIQK